MSSWNYEEEFAKDEDIESAFDDIINGICEQIEFEEKSDFIVDPVKVYQVKFVHKVMKYLTRGTGAKVAYELHTPFRSMGNVSVEYDSLTIHDPVWFSRAASFATNLEVYPLVNGKFRMTFTFHGLTRNIT